MGPESFNIIPGKFTERIPPSFDGVTSYATYCSDVALWCKLTSLDASKLGPALVGQLSGEAKHSANNIAVEILCSDDGAKKLLQHLDQSYAVDDSDKLDSDLADFLSYTWKKSLSVEQFIIGFNARLDKIAEVQLSEKVKGHIMLRQAALEPHERSMIIGASSGKFELKPICAALRAAYRDRATGALPSIHHATSSAKASTHNTASQINTPRAPSPGFRPTVSKDGDWPTFLSPNIAGQNEPPGINSNRAIIDTGACASIVGKSTLDDYMNERLIKRLTNAQPTKEEHRFGHHDQNHETMFAVKVPFHLRSSKWKPGPTPSCQSTAFEITFDVIEGNLPFLIGLPSLTAMHASMNFQYNHLSLTLNGLYKRFALERCSNHLYLPFELELVNPKRGPAPAIPRHPRGQTKQLYYSPAPSASYFLPIKRDYKRPLPRKQHMPSTQYYYANTSHNVRFETIDKKRGATETPSGDPTSYATHKTSVTPADLRKLHIQLRHGSCTAVEQYLKAASLWHEELRDSLTNIVKQCPCYKTYNKPVAPVASANPPVTEKQSAVALDIIYLSQRMYLHIVDKHTGWSETCYLATRALSYQIDAFHRTYTLRHGPPNEIMGDQEYNKRPFLEYCESIESTFIPVPAQSHNCNGSIERANRTLRMFYDRLRECDQKSHIDLIVLESTYGKNICRGAKCASAFELLYNRRPRVMSKIDRFYPPLKPDMAKTHAVDSARRRVNALLRSSSRIPDQINVGDTVLFWRDAEGWLGPSVVEQVSPHTIHINHNNRIKTAGRAQTRLVPSPIENDSANKLETYNYDVLPSADQDSTTHGEPNFDLDQSTPNIDHEPSMSTPPLSPPAPVSDEPTKLDSTPRRPTLRSDTRKPTKLGKEVKALQEEANRFINNENYLSPQKLDTYSTKHPAPITVHEKNRAYTKELQNWAEHKAFVPKRASEVPITKNIIGSHVIYRRKPNNEVKARIVPWGHKDLDRDTVRTDAPCLNPDAFRLLMSISAERNWNLGQMDATAAFLQSKGFDREIYVRPPREEKGNDLWMLTAAAYGLCDSGRLWYNTSDIALVQHFGLQRSKTEYALYYKHDKVGNLVFMLVTQVDNYIYGGNPDEMKAFESFLQKEFKIGALDRDVFSVMGCHITRDADNSITMSQKEKIEELTFEPLSSAAANRPANEICSPSDITTYKSCIGQMLFIGRLSHPHMMYLSSHMASKTPALEVHHLRDLAAIVKREKRTFPSLFYDGRFDPSVPTELVAYSDAALCCKKEIGGRSGFIVFRTQGDIAHPVSWSAKKLRRIARSSSTAELLGAADATSHLLYLKTLLLELLPLTHHHQSRLVLDSRCLYRLCCSTNSPMESMNKVELASIREAFENGLLNAVAWQPGHYHIADPLTKDNRITSALLTKVLREGSYPAHPSTLTEFSASGPDAPLQDYDEAVDEVIAY